MRIICFILLTIISIQSVEKKCNHRTIPNLEFNVELKGSYKLTETVNTLESEIYYLVETKLINHGDSTVKFITFTCTAIGNIALSSKDVQRCVNRCSSNSPKVIELKPKQEFAMPIILKSINKNLNYSLRIGWILVNAKLLPDIDFKKVVSESSKDGPQDIIWSNSIFLDASGGKPYEIFTP